MDAPVSRHPERNFWEAPETYSAMSPFNHAEKITAPLLLIHSQADPNPGTYPMQSERLFAAIKGLGGQARLCLIPNEGHFYRARESIMHVLAEQDAWLEKHVKHAKKSPNPTSTVASTVDEAQHEAEDSKKQGQGPGATPLKSKL